MNPIDVRRVSPAFVFTMFTALLSAGCLGQAMKVEAVARPDAAERISYVIRAGTPRSRLPGVGPDAENYVRTALSAKGMYEAPAGQPPDLDIVYVFDIQRKQQKLDMVSPTSPSVGRDWPAENPI